jgi:hypothetical protein
MKYKQRIVKFLLATSMVLSLVAVVSTVHAAEPEKLFNPLEATVDPSAPVQSLAAIFINALFGIAGSVALAMYVWGGVLWLTSAGEAKKVDQGKGVIQWTTLGIIMMFAAYTLVSYIFSSFGTGSVGGATGGVAGTPAGQGTGVADKLCCLNYNTNKAMTVSNPGDCSGSNTYVYNGECSKQKFCASTLDKNSLGPSLTCAPVLTTCPADAPNVYTSFENCMISQKPAAGAGGAPVISQSKTCTAQNGSCIDTSVTKCATKPITGICPGAGNIQCCVK